MAFSPMARHPLRSIWAFSIIRHLRFGDWVFASTAAKHPAAPPPIIKRSVSFLIISISQSSVISCQLSITIVKDNWTNFSMA